MRVVYDYKDIRRLEDSAIGEELRNGIIVTATSELASALDAYYPDYSVIDIHSFISDIIPEWEMEVKDIKNYVMLRNVVEEYIADNNINETVSMYLRRNTKDIWNAIKLLIEADVFPDNIPDNMSAPIDNFKNIWKKLEIQNDKIVTFRSTFLYELHQKDKLIEKISKETEEIRENLYLIGFYFITPLQDRIFDILSEAGFNLKYLNCHDSSYAHATEIWERTFREEYQSGAVIDIQKDIISDNAFGEALKGKQSSKIEINQHYNDFQFAEMVEDAVKKGESIYSPNVTKCEKILREYLPERYKDKHLLSYPVGQYVYYLHHMWNERENRPELKYDYVFKCFSTGWLTVDELNAKDFLYEIKLFKPYFRDCLTVDDWKKRLDELDEAKETLSCFDEREHGNERWHKLLGNPFYNIGVYSISSEDVSNIIILINKLIEDATYLFSGDIQTDLYEHFQKIVEIIDEHMPDEDTLQEEQDIANMLIDQLSDDSTKGLICPMNGVKDAILLLIGDYDDYESFDTETKKNERIVLPISMIEAETLRNYGQKIHLVLADEMNLPGKPKDLPWPLTDELLDALEISNENTAKYVSDMRNVIDNRPLSNRYLFYSFLGEPQEDKVPVSVEWICKNDKKKVDVSPYVRLVFDVEETDYKLSIDNEDIVADSSDEYVYAPVAFPERGVPEEVEMDYLLCRQRYIYSYITNYLPTFSSEFHYSFELSNLISAITIVSGRDKREVADEIKKLFPFLRNIEFWQAVDFAKAKEAMEPYIYGDIEYPAQRLATHYINRLLLSEGRKRHDEYVEEGQVAEDRYKAGCIYCPYADICTVRFKDEDEAYEQEVLDDNS